MYRVFLVVALALVSGSAFAGQEASVLADEATTTQEASANCADGRCGVFRQRSLVVTNSCGEVVRSRSFCRSRSIASSCGCAVRNTASACKEVACGTVRTGARIVRGTGRLLFGRRRCCN